MYKCPKCGQTESGFSIRGSMPVKWIVDSEGDTVSYEEDDGANDSWSGRSPTLCRNDDCKHEGTVDDFEKAAEQVAIRRDNP